MRNDFSEATKRIIASRAGYTCSFPGCNKLLIGPGKNHDDILHIGECAHIFAASSNGPRRGNLTEDQYKSAMNGIYLCHDHHKEIDANNGNSYTSDQLITLKAMHENKIALQMGQIPYYDNWIRSVTLDFPDLFGNSLKFNLGKVTHIYGGKGIGKTALAECIYMALTGQKIKRWRDSTFTMNFEIGSEKKVLMVQLSKNNNSYILNGKIIPLLSENYRIIFLDNITLESQDDCECIARSLNFDVSSVCSIICSDVFIEYIGFKPELNIRREKPYLVRELYIKNQYDELIPFKECSTYEQVMFIFNVGLFLARSFTPHNTVVFILDFVCFQFLDEEYIQQIFEVLSEPSNFFQSIVITHEKVNCLKWQGWELVKLIGEKRNVEIRQNELYEIS